MLLRTKTDAMKRVHVRLYGRVQGVGFRVFVLRQAQLLGITGTVRNVYFPHRCVEIVAEGEADTLEVFLARVQAGPAMARVERMESEWSEATGTFVTFRII